MREASHEIRVIHYLERQQVVLKRNWNKHVQHEINSVVNTYKYKYLRLQGNSHHAEGETISTKQRNILV